MFSILLTIIIKKESENVQNLFDFSSFQNLDNTEEIMDSSKDSENMNISDNDSKEITYVLTYTLTPNFMTNPKFCNQSQ